MKSKRELAKEQISMMHEIQSAGFNMVTCGNCGTLLIHRTDDKEDIDCFGCQEVMAKSDCPDYWYTGCEESAEFNETEEL